MEIEAFVFDMDGVILDTESVSFRTWETALSEFGVSGGRRAEVQRLCMGTNKAGTIEILRGKFGADFEAEKFLSRTSELFSQIESTEGLSLMPHARECLEALSRRFRIALASSTRKEAVTRQLSRAGVLGFFEEVVTGDMVTRSKPDPEIYLMACSRLGLAPEKCAAVEDSPNGIRSAKSAGLMPIMIPDQIQPSPELEALLYRKFTSLKELVEFSPSLL